LHYELSRNILEEIKKSENIQVASTTINITAFLKIKLDSALDKTTNRRSA
jgi:hypothetical protein